MQLLRTAGGLLLQREIPEEVNAQAAQVEACTWRHAANPTSSPLQHEDLKCHQSTGKASVKELHTLIVPFAASRASSLLDLFQQGSL